MSVFLYFSNLLGKNILDSQGNHVGTLCDVGIKIGGEVYPKATILIVRKGFLCKKFVRFSWEEIQDINDTIRLKVIKEEISYEKNRIKCDFSLCNDILDQQVVDTDNQKVVRVNDVHFLRVDNQLFLAHVDVGLRGLVRRLGWTSVVDGIVRIFSPKALYLKKEELLPWKSTQVLSLGRAKNVLKLDVARQKLSQIPPTELAEIMEDLDKFEKYSLFKSLDVALQRKVFTDLSPGEKEELVDQLDDSEVVSLLENTPSDEAADLLLKLDKERTIELMKLMQTQTSKRLRHLLGFAQDTAGGLMTTEYLYVGPEATVEDAIRHIKENIQYPGNIYHVYILDAHNRFLGSTSIRRLINAEANTPITETCYPKKIFVRPDDGMEEIALLLEKYKFSSVPVLNEDDVLQGVITIDDVLEELISLAWSKYKEKL